MQQELFCALKERKSQDIFVVLNLISIVHSKPTLHASGMILSKPDLKTQGDDLKDLLYSKHNAQLLTYEFPFKHPIYFPLWEINCINLS